MTQDPTKAPVTTTPVTPPAEPVTPVVPPVEPQEDVSNKDVKDHPVFQAMAKKLNAFQDAETKAAEDKAAADKLAEETKLKDAGKFDELKALNDKTIADLQATHKADLLNRDLQTELIKVGFKNDHFNQGAINQYTDESGTPAEYAKKLADNETNKAFLSTSRNPQVPPATTVLNNGAPITMTELNALRGSTNIDDQVKAAEYTSNYLTVHGKLPA